MLTIEFKICPNDHIGVTGMVGGRDGWSEIEGEEKKERGGGEREEGREEALL